MVVALVDKPAYSAHVPVTTRQPGPDVIPVITGNRPVIHSRQWNPVTSQPDIDIHTAASRGFIARPKVKVKPAAASRTLIDVMKRTQSVEVSPVECSPSLYYLTERVISLMRTN